MPYRRESASKVNLMAEFAAIYQKVSDIESDYKEMRTALVMMDKKVDDSFQAISTKIEQMRMTPWLPIWGGVGVFISVASFIGYLAFQPINTDLLNLHKADTETSRVVTLDNGYAHSRITSIERQIFFIEGYLAAKDPNLRYPIAIPPVQP